MILTRASEPIIQYAVLTQEASNDATQEGLRSIFMSNERSISYKKKMEEDESRIPV